MKTLFIARHAESGWGAEGVPDFDRILNSRGEKDALAMGQHLNNSGYVPELMVSSPAVRAMTTARILAEQIDYPADQIAVSQNIYEAMLQALINIIQCLNDTHSSVMLVGHNPGLTELVDVLLSKRQILNMAACGVAVLQFDSDSWSGIVPGSGELISYLQPERK